MERNPVIVVNFKCSWRDYHRAVLAKLKFTPFLAKRPWSMHSAAVISSTFARLTKLRGAARYEFDEVGVRRFKDGVEQVNFLWADFTHWEKGGNACWLMSPTGACLVPLRSIDDETQAQLSHLFELKLGPCDPLRPMNEFEKA